MQNGSSLTLADLIRLDWAIAEQGKVVRMTKQSIADQTMAGIVSSEQVEVLATLEQPLDDLT